MTTAASPTCTSAATAPGEATPTRPDLLVCPECEAVYQRHPLPPGSRVRCRRCGATLDRSHWLGIQGQLALTVGAAVVFLMASTMPLVSLELRGIDSVATLFEAIVATWDDGEHLLALLALATAFVFPLAVISLRLWVLPPLMVGRRPPGFIPVMRALRFVLRWSMVEVLLLAALIAIVRSAGVTQVVVGPGLIACGALVVLLAGIEACGLHELWRAAEGPAR